MKRIKALLMAVCLTACMLVPAYGAAGAESDVMRCAGWTVGGEDGTVYEFVLNPKYVSCAAAVRVSDGINHSFTKTTVRRESVDGLGECFVLTLITERHSTEKAQIAAGSFYDADGIPNAAIRLGDAAGSIGTCPQLMETDRTLSDSSVTVIEQGTNMTITFARNGTVVFDGNTLADNADAYTLTFSEEGDHTLSLSVNDLYSRTYRICVKSAGRIREEKKAQLQQELSEEWKAFFASIPLAIVTLPLFPLSIFGFLWPFAPFEIAGQIIDTLQQLRNL